jgi:positive regulator of sigma E activity
MAIKLLKTKIMTKFFKYTEYIYLIIGFLSLNVIYSNWNIDKERAYLFIFFAIISFGMFLFRRTYRKKFDKRQQDNKQ